MRGAGISVLVLVVCIVDRTSARFIDDELFDRFDVSDGENAYESAAQLIENYFEWHSEQAKVAATKTRLDHSMNEITACGEVKAAVFRPVDSTDLGTAIGDLPQSLELALKSGRMFFIDWEWHGRRATEFFEARFRRRDGSKQQHLANLDWEQAKKNGIVCREAVDDAVYVRGGVPTSINAAAMLSEADGFNHDALSTEAFEIKALEALINPTAEMEELLANIKLEVHKAFFVVVAAQTGWHSKSEATKVQPYLSLDGTEVDEFDKCMSTMVAQAVESARHRDNPLKSAMKFYVSSDDTNVLERLKKNKDASEFILASSLTSRDKGYVRWVDFFVYGRADAILFSNEFRDADVGSMRGGSAVLRRYVINSDNCCKVYAEGCDKGCATPRHPEVPALGCKAVLVSKTTHPNSAHWTFERPGTRWANQLEDMQEDKPFGHAARDEL